MTHENTQTTETASVTATPADAPPVVAPPVDAGEMAASPDDPHLHCLHWDAELHGTNPRMATARCCWDDYSVDVSEKNPALTGEHGPDA